MSPSIPPLSHPERRLLSTYTQYISINAVAGAKLHRQGPHAAPAVALAPAPITTEPVGPRCASPTTMFSRKWDIDSPHHVYSRPVPSTTYLMRSGPSPPNHRLPPCLHPSNPQKPLCPNKTRQTSWASSGVSWSFSLCAWSHSSTRTMIPLFFRTLMATRALFIFIQRLLSGGSPLLLHFPPSPAPTVPRTSQIANNYRS